MSEFPDGRYVSAVGALAPRMGGQTTAMLMRSRILSAVRGEPVDVLTFNSSPNYDATRAELARTGQLAGGMRVLNLYEHYREHGWGDEVPTGEMLPELSGLQAIEVNRPDGSPWRTAYVEAGRGVAFNDFRRRDGSVYLRAPVHNTTVPTTSPGERVRVDPHGQVLGRFTSLTEWSHRWLDELAPPGQPMFLFTDSRFLLPVVAPIKNPSIYLIYVLHNCHLAPPRTWTSKVHRSYRRLLDRVGDVDAFVTLTRRQGDDIARRWGARSTLEVVPNPVESPAWPDPVPVRDPFQVVVLSRLEQQKRLDHAVLVFAQVLAAVPEAQLHIYGSGSKKAELQQSIDERGLTDHVTMHGYDRNARETLWTASAFLLTSRYEGYPLSTLESLSRGCPVVSYDVPYGPREQISDGVDGFIVPDSDIDGAAARVIQLLDDPALVDRMGAAARRKALLHDENHFLADWAQVLNRVVERAPRRVQLTNLQLDLDVRRAADRSSSLELSGRLRVDSEPASADPAMARLSLVAVDTTRGGFVELPLSVQRRDRDFDLGATIDVRALMRSTKDLRRAKLQLRLDWENAHWRTVVSSPEPVAGRGVKQNRRGVVVLRRVRAKKRAAKPPPRRRTPIEKVVGRLRRIAGTLGGGRSR